MPLILPSLVSGYTPAGGFSRTFVDNWSSTIGSVTSSTLSSQTLGAGEIWVFVAYNDASATLNGVTVNGVSATLATDGVDSANVSQISIHMAVYHVDCSVASGDIVLSFSATTQSWAVANVHWFRVNGRTSIDDVTVDTAATATSPVVDVLNVTTEANGIILAGAYGSQSGSVYTWTGATEDATLIGPTSGQRSAVASAINQTAGAKTVEASATISSGTARRVGVSVAIS